MNVEIGAEAAQFPEKEYINGIAVAVWYRRSRLFAVVALIQPKWLPLSFLWRVGFFYISYCIVWGSAGWTVV